MSYQSLWRLRSLDHYLDQHPNCSQMHCHPKKNNETTVFSLLAKQQINVFIECFCKLKCTYFLNKGHSAARVPARAERSLSVFLYQGKIVSSSQLSLKKERRAHTTKLSMGDDSNTIAENISFIHMMGGKKDSPT